VNAAIFRLELRRSRSLVGWLVVTLFLYGGIMAIFYPRMRDSAAEFNKLLDLWPKELLAAFGMSGTVSLGDPGVFFNVYLGSMLWPVVAAIGAILLATRSTAADVDRGWAEASLAAPVSRIRYLSLAIGVQAVAMAILAATMIAGVLAVGWLVDAGFDAPRFALAGVLGFVYACAIAAVTTLLGALTLSRGVAGGIVAGVLLAMYLLQAVAQIDPGLDWLKYLSSFHYYDSASIIDTGAFAWGDCAIFGFVAVASWGLAIAVFRRRDLVA
jgi:ABC-2 type transport system permease protein